MKLKDGLVMREVAGEYVVLNANADVDLHGIVTLNETGATLWNCLQQEGERADLTAALLNEYDVDEKTAMDAAAAFVEKLKERNLLV